MANKSDKSARLLHYELFISSSLDYEDNTGNVTRLAIRSYWDDSYSKHIKQHLDKNGEHKMENPSYWDQNETLRFLLWLDNKGIVYFTPKFFVDIQILGYDPKKTGILNPIPSELEDHVFKVTHILSDPAIVDHSNYIDEYGVGGKLRTYSLMIIINS